MLSERELVRDTDQEMVFAHRAWKGLVVFALSLAGLVVLWVLHLMFESSSGSSLGFFYANSGLLAGMALGLAFWRERFELRLNFVSKGYVKIEGIGGINTVRGPLSDIKSVCLKERIKMRTLSTNPNVDTEAGTEWTLRLELADPAKSIDLMAGTDEQRAYYAMDKIAGRLKIPVVDSTPRRRPKAGPATPVSEPAVQIPEPLPSAGTWPFKQRSGPSSDISISGTPGRRLIVLPSIGFRLNEVIVMILSGVCAGIGFVLHWLLASEPDVSPIAREIVRDGLVLVGALGFGMAAARCLSREFVQEESDDLHFGCYLFGVPIGSRWLEKWHIKEIVVSPGPVNRWFDSERLGFFQFAWVEMGEVTDDDVFVRSDRAIVRFGRDLDADDKSWLMEELNAWRHGP